MKRIILITALMVTISCGLIQAQNSNGTTSRQAVQQAKIAKGVKDKDLTRKETIRLEKEQKRIQKEKGIAKSDGTVTPKEKRFLRHEQNRANRHIKMQKNDKQKRKLS